MAEYVLGYITNAFTDQEDWQEVCRVEADSADSPVTRILDVTDEQSTEHIVRWNLERYPDLSSPRFLAADIGHVGTYREVVAS